MVVKVYLCIFDPVIDFVIEFFADVLFGVGAVDLDDLEVALGARPPNVVEAELVPDAAVLDAAGPVLPDLPRQPVPGLLLAGLFPHVLLEDVRLAAVVDDELAQQGLGVEEALLEALPGLQEMLLEVDLFQQVHYVPDWPSDRIELREAVPGNGPLKVIVDIALEVEG